MSESNRVLRLDSEAAIEVPLAGKTYWIRKQRRSVLEKVLIVLHPDGPERELPKESSTREWIQFDFQRWQNAIPTLALLLGVEETDPEYSKTLEHLDQHLTFGDAQKVFEAWWELNEVERFFAFAGNPLIPAKRFSEFQEAQKNVDVLAESEKSSETQTSPSTT